MSLPAAQPAYIFRGHAAQIHSAAFIRSNTRLITGDAEGWIVCWLPSIRRPTAVWKAHDGTILGLDAWGNGKIITHGKDNKLIVWKLCEDEEGSMSTALPVDAPPELRRQPWILYVLDVNTMNFCSFAHCPPHFSTTQGTDSGELLIAVPNILTSETVDIFHLPSCKRMCTIPNAPNLKGGMIMAVSFFHQPQSKALTLIAGYESGHTAVSMLNSATNTWHVLYLSQPHTQPLLSLDALPSKDYYFTSSADAVIAKHRIPTHSAADASMLVNIKEEPPWNISKTGHSGQQGLKIRSDGRILATAGWDGRVRVYSTKSMKELAVLKWHKEGCYAIAFARLLDEGDGRQQEQQNDAGVQVVQRGKKLTIREERERIVETGHWLVVGSKDAKVSLWDIY